MAGLLVGLAFAPVAGCATGGAQPGLVFGDDAIGGGPDGDIVADAGCGASQSIVASQGSACSACTVESCCTPLEQCASVSGCPSIFACLVRCDAPGAASGCASGCGATASQAYGAAAALLACQQSLCSCSPGDQGDGGLGDPTLDGGSDESASDDGPTGPMSDGGPADTGTGTDTGTDAGGCIPESDPCNGQPCGSVVNNCQQRVFCGNAGQCANPGDVCMANQCCTPNSCGAQGCGCAAGQECVNAACCTPNGTCSGDCLDSCGVYDGACCGGPADGGGEEPTCTQDGAACTSDADCCSANCYSDGTGGGMCGPPTCVSGGPCSSTSECCYPQMCVLTAMVQIEAIGGPGEGGVPIDASTSICQ